MAKRKAALETRIPPPGQAIQYKVTLNHLRPSIWRQLVLLDNMSLGDLHEAIQLSFGWENAHLHAFRFDRVRYVDDLSMDVALDDDEKSEFTALLGQVAATPKQKFRYDYDFGDSWEHEVVVEKLLPFDPTAPYPACLAGARACPPEDCGGVFGYENILEALQAKNRTEEQKETLEWVGEDFDPERFDLEAVNLLIRRR